MLIQKYFITSSQFLTLNNVKVCKVESYKVIKLKVSVELYKLSTFPSSLIALTPGNSFPSIYSSIAPPPVET